MISQKTGGLSLMKHYDVTERMQQILQTVQLYAYCTCRTQFKTAK